MDGYDQMPGEISERMLPAVIAPGLLWRWFVLQELKLERKIFASNQTGEKYQALWRMTLGRKVGTPDGSVGLTERDQQDVKRSLKNFFSQHDFDVQEVKFEFLEESTGRRGSYRSWDVLVVLV